MLRFVAAIIAISVAAGTCARAADMCSGYGSPSQFTVQDWSVKVSKDAQGFTGSTVAVKLLSATDKPVRMIDGSVIFQDALGQWISSIAIDRDVKLAPGETLNEKGTYLGTGLDRIPNMNRDDVVVSTCTKAVIYADGTKQQFN